MTNWKAVAENCLFVSGSSEQEVRKKLYVKD